MFGLSTSGFSHGWNVPAGVGNAGGLMVPNAHKSAPGTPHPGEKKRCACLTQHPLARRWWARAKQGANHRASKATTRASGSPDAVGTGLSSAAAGGSGWRMFEAQPSLRQTRLLRAAQGTAQRPCLRLAFSLVRFFWRSKRNELGRRAETRLATKEKTSLIKAYCKWL